MGKRFILLTALLAVCVMTGLVLAQDGQKPPVPPSNKPGGEMQPGGENRELLDFLKKNHPEVFEEFRKQMMEQRKPADNNGGIVPPPPRDGGKNPGNNGGIVPPPPREGGQGKPMPGNVDGKRPQGDKPDGQNRFNMTEEERQEMLEFVRLYHYEAEKQIQQIKRENSEALGGYMMGFIDEYRAMKANPEQMEEFKTYLGYDKETRHLVKLLKEAKTDEEKTGVKTKLQEVLGSMFDLREKVREKQIEKKEKEIQEEKDKRAKRREMKATIIEKRINDIMAEDPKENIKW